ncbi:MAG: endolytic transglycosylase MltG, partial [candidate division WOR-3 bacterium]|nr:endolytic transglycosylase MltG [candidate division WOR-3 bacterium]
MKSKNRFTFTIFVILIILTITTLPNVLTSIRGTEEILFEVSGGETLSSIAERLALSDVIDQPDIFILLAKMLDIDRKIKSGRYLLTKNTSEYTVLMKMYRGEVLLERITVPEGFNMYQIAGRVQSIFGIDSLDFLKTCRSRALLREFNIEGDNCEGFLFPDTYLIARGKSGNDIVRIMLERFEEEYPDTLFKDNQFGFSRYRYITLASMIEKEAVLEREKPIIAGVYYNRLERGMLLQCCATVLYALGEPGRVTTYEDLKVESPYNTYKHP